MNLIFKIFDKKINFSQINSNEEKDFTISINEEDYYDDIISIFHLKNSKIPKKYNSLSDILGFNSKELLLSIPRQEINKNFSSIKNEIEILLKNNQKNENYIYRTINTRNFIQKFYPLRVNKEWINDYITKIDPSFHEEIEKTKKFLQTDEFSRIKKIDYNISSSITGRMSVKKDLPNVLTISNNIKGGYLPYSDEYDLYEADITSSEPQIALITIGKELPDDIYLDISKSLGDKLTRQQAKLLTLQLLYGKRCFEEINLPKTEIKNFLYKVKDYFEYDKLLNIIKSNINSGVMRNYFGRPIYLTNEFHDSLLINYYLQSSSVDFAVEIFSKFCEDNKEDVLPHFLKHDAITFSIKKDSELLKNTSCLPLFFEGRKISNKIIKMN